MSLEHLDVSHCGVGGGEMAVLVEGLSACKQLQELRMAGGSFTSAGTRQLCRSVKSFWKSFHTQSESVASVDRDERLQEFLV